MRNIGPPPGWVNPHTEEEAGVLDTPGEPSAQEPEPRESNVSGSSGDTEAEDLAEKIFCED
eukprot:6411085-Karenia_brevis.AAC.1